MQGEKELVRIILCLQVSSLQAPPNGGFKRHTYGELWAIVRSELRKRPGQGAGKWMIYLEEFMETTTRLTGETAEEKEVTAFFIENHDVIEKLLQDRQRLLGRLGKTIAGVFAGVQAAALAETHPVRRWIYQNTCLASHYTIAGSVIGLDLSGDMSGWRLTAFNFRGSGQMMTRLLATPAITLRQPNPPIERNRPVLQKWNLDVEPAILLRDLVQWFEAVASAINTILPPVVQPI